VRENLRFLLAHDLVVVTIEAEEVLVADQQAQVSFDEALDLNVVGVDFLVEIEVEVLAFHHFVVVELEILTMTLCTFLSSFSGDFVFDSKLTVTINALYSSESCL
jgi:hypothetical protein